MVRVSHTSKHTRLHQLSVLYACVQVTSATSWALLATPWIVAHQAPLSMGFSKQEYWGGLPWPSSGNLPDPGIKPTSLMSPALVDGFFTISTTQRPTRQLNSAIIYPETASDPTGKVLCSRRLPPISNEHCKLRLLSLFLRSLHKIYI